MGALSDNPVLLREVRGRLRLRKLSGRAWKVAAVVLTLIIARYYYMGVTAVQRGRADDAAYLWEVFSMLALGLIVLFAPSMAATAISQEREQQTWDLLQVTRLSGWQVILGKWLARQTIPAMVIVLAVPVIIVCAIHGEAGPLGAFANIAYLLLNCAFFSALGLWCSSIVRRTPTATASALLIVAAICVGTVVIDMIIESFSSWIERQNSVGYTMWINPFYALDIIDGVITKPMEANLGARYHLILTSVTVEAAFTAIFLILLVRGYGGASVRRRQGSPMERREAAVGDTPDGSDGEDV